MLLEGLRQSEPKKPLIFRAKASMAEAIEGKYRFCYWDIGSTY